MCIMNAVSQQKVMLDSGTHIGLAMNQRSLVNDKEVFLEPYPRGTPWGVELRRGCQRRGLDYLPFHWSPRLASLIFRGL